MNPPSALQTHDVPSATKPAAVSHTHLPASYFSPRPVQSKNPSPGAGPPAPPGNGILGGEEPSGDGDEVARGDPLGKGVPLGEFEGFGVGVLKGDSEGDGLPPGVLEGDGLAPGLDVGVGRGSGFAASPTFEKSQRCRPPSDFVRLTAFDEQSLDVTPRNLLHPFSRSFTMMRYVPSSPDKGTKRSKDFFDPVSSVTDLDAASSQDEEDVATDPKHLNKRKHTMSHVKPYDRHKIRHQ